MSSSTRIHLAAALGLTLTAGLALAVAPPAAKPEQPPRYKVTGPFTHENLTIFFLHGEDQIKGSKILTLDEALKEKKIIVHETKNVSQLAVENGSATESVFIQAGDIVKGGQQDRTIALDLLLQPKSGKVPVPSFCVERGRWSRRGGEDVKAFNRSNDAIVGNDLKLAARKDNNQGKVWEGVGKAQAMLRDNLKASVMAKTSSSSLALTLEHKKLLEAVDVYTKKLQGILDKQTDVIGYAVAINGKVNNADVYASAELFRKLWPKLLKSTVVEAVAEKKDKLKIEKVLPEAVTVFLAEAAKGKKTQKKTIRELCEIQCESSKNVLFLTQDKTGAVLRRSYVGK
jgi:hypothetical protein